MLNDFYQFLHALGYPHPIHPSEVHLPIGLIVASVIFGYGAKLFHRPDWAVTARRCFVLAFLFLFPTMLFGIMDWQHFYHGAWLFPIEIKVFLASFLLVLAAVGVAVGRRTGPHARSALAFYTVGFFCVVLLGYFGGQLVYGGRTVPGPKEFKAGEAVFDNNCSGCHPHGGNIVVTNLPLRSAPQLEQFQTFVKFIRNPTLPNGSPGPMPAFPPKELSDAQSRQLYDYIVNTLEKPKRQ
jgi:uncharacterized membrane protein